MPIVSVMLCTYNDEKFIRDAVKSILNQTFKDFEFIIINDGSTDKTSEILESFSDDRIRIFHQTNMGIVKSRRKSIELSVAEYIAIQDADDISLPERLEKQVNYLDRNKDIGLVGTARFEIEEDGTILYPRYFPEDNDIIQKKLIKENCFCGPSIMFRKYIYEKIGGYRIEFETSEDYDLVLRFAEMCKLHNLREVLYKKRINPDGITVTRHDQMRAYHMLACILAKERRAGRNEYLEVNKARIIGKVDEDISKDTFISNLLRQLQKLFILSKNYYAFGCVHLYKGNLKRAQGLFLRSLRYNFLHIKAYICLFLTLLPFNLVKHLKYFFKGTAQLCKDLNGTCQ